MRLLVTRPLPEAERTAAALRARGHEAVVAPALRVEITSPAFGSGPFSALVVTSGNAARALKDHPQRGDVKNLPLFAVGARSAAAARESGFENVISAGGDVNDLAGLLAKTFARQNATLLYLAGEDRAGDLAAALAPGGIRVETVVVYRAVPDQRFADLLGSALAAGSPDGVLHYSRRSAEAFLAGARAGGVTARVLPLAHFCLSAEVAAPLISAGATNTIVAAHPDEASLLALLSPA
jgi:uroporphyrinogen-III synthase